MTKQIQPTTKKSPPTGVMIPSPPSPTLPVAFKSDSAYNEPENKRIPIKKHTPAQFIDLKGNFSKRIPTINSANA